ncbi:hypothetical protein ACFRCG_07285 [Embleya sp. NPDC056575]|uniref:hypothetical protein n=1 Tax=unclassified Embleya TaxID=2699296 RepID=UPI0036BAF9A7
MECRIREVPIASSVLDYEVVTDPTPLLARPGTPAVGTVRVVVSNPHPRAGTVKWFTIEVKVPVGTGASDVTSGPTEVRPAITENSGGRRVNLTAAADVNGLVAYRAQVNHELWAARSEATELTAGPAHVPDLTAITADL